MSGGGTSPSAHRCLMKTLLLLLTLFSVVVPGQGQQPGFNTDSAYAVLRVLAGEIGPRTMGSPAEQRALAYAASTFARHGCDTSYVLPITDAQGVNTSTGVAVGVSRGTGGRIIVIGGHMDTSGPEIPGACDDGSGCAVVIECARVLSRRPHTSTYLFCCFGGEEDGLRGSSWFVKHFPQIDSVDLMLQADMADGSSYLEAYVDGPRQISAPEWLTRAAFEVFYRELGYTGLIYNTHFSSLNASGEGAAGSDHNDFLKRGIPAAAFVSDVSYPIHTPQDDLEHFTPSGLARTGNLILGLVARFDGGVPSRGTGTYYLLQSGPALLFVDHGLLWILIGAAVGLALAGLVVARRRRKRIEPRIRRSGLKLLGVVLLIQAALWSSESIVGLLTGWKFPWVNRFGWYLLLALASGAVAVWAGTLVVRHFRLTRESYGFYVKAVVYLLVLLAALIPVGPEAAVYPAWGLFWIGAAILARSSRLKLLFVLVAPLYLLRLLFMEGTEFWQRLLTQIPLEGLGQSLAYNAGFVLVFTLISFPFASAFAGVFRESGVDYFWLRRWRFRWVGAASLLAVVLLSVLLAAQGMGYADTWRRLVRVEQRSAAGADSSKILLRSSESLDGITLSFGGHDTTLAGRGVSYGPIAAGPVRWLDVVESKRHLRRDSTDRIERMLDLRSVRRPYRISLVYLSDGEFLLETAHGTGPRSPMSADGPRRRTLEWYSFPPEHLPVRVLLEVRPGQRIMEELEVVCDTTPLDVQVRGPWVNLTRRTTVTRRDTLVGS